MRPLRPVCHFNGAAASPMSSIPPCQPGMAGWTMQDRDDATTPVASRAAIGLGGDSKPCNQLGHPDTCGCEEQLLPSLLQPSSPAVSHFLLAGADSPRVVVVWCDAMQMQTRCACVPAVEG